MKTFVIHYPKLVERKARLVREFERLGMEVEWVEHWNKEDPFIQRIKEATKSPLGLGHLSAFVKRLWCYQKMVDEDIDKAFIFEDDVVFSPEFETLKIPKGFDYLRLGIGISENVKFDNQNVYVINNPGGGEASWVSKRFASFFLDNLKFNYSHDLIEAASLGYTGDHTNLRGIPVCSQYGFESSCEGSDGNDRDWIIFYKMYDQLEKYKWSDLKKLEEDVCESNSRRD